ncbi:hypothetical protein B2J88_44765 [Rhodococcus sp. SRB_17]|nr:hypothetical protein [Rhodococcus sp. SRB_17]
MATHLAQTHDMLSETYRAAHGLPLGVPLVAASVQARTRTQWHAHADLHMPALEEQWKPNTAQKGNRPRSQWTSSDAQDSLTNP